MLKCAKFRSSWSLIQINLVAFWVTVFSPKLHTKYIEIHRRNVLRDSFTLKTPFERFPCLLSMFCVHSIVWLLMSFMFGYCNYPTS